MTVESISWSISTKECCRPRRGLNPRPPGLQSDGASNWATEVLCGLFYEAIYFKPCVSLFLCFSVLLALRLPRLGKRQLILVLFVRLFDLHLFGFVCLLLPLGVCEGLRLVIVALPGLVSYLFRLAHIHCVDLVMRWLISARRHTCWINLSFLTLLIVWIGIMCSYSINTYLIYLFCKVMKIRNSIEFPADRLVMNDFVWE